MAQIIKHRRGSISSLKGTTARNGELIIASGSISDLSGPFVFIGSPNVGDEGVAGAFRSVSKIYQGTTAPTITAGTYGSILDGTPFYSTGNESLYILNNDGGGGNTRIDLTGNIEGNLISGVTINNLTGSTGNFNTYVSSSALRVNNDAQIGGLLTVTGSISGSNLYLSGDANIDGNINLGGNITIGNQTTDIIQFGGEVSSSIVPILNNSFDLGSADNAWRDLYVSGTAHIENINLQTLSLNSLALPGDFTVSGTTILSGSVFVEDLTNDRVVIVGLNGQLEDDANFTYDGTTLKVGTGVGNFEVDVFGGHIRTSGSVFVNSNLNVSGSVALGDMSMDSITVSGSLYTHNTTYLGDMNTSFGDALIVSGAIRQQGDNNINGNLIVSGNVDLGDMSNDNIIVSGTLYTHNTTNVGDMNTLFGNALVVSGAIQQLGDNNINGNLIVSGNVALGDMFNDNIIVSGTLYTHNTTNIGDMNTLFGDALIVSGAIQQLGDNNINGNLIVSGNVALGDSFSDNLIASGTLYTHNTTYIGDMNTLFGDALIVSGAIKQTGNQNIDGDVSITGSLTTDGITNNGDLTVNGILTVTGETRLQSNLYVSGNLEVLGSATNVLLQSSTVEIGDNIILVNAYSPFQRYAGLSAYDSGSIGASGSMLWDSQNDYWLLVSGSGESSKVIGTTAGTYGTEVNLTSGTFPIATSTNTIGDSLLTYSGTTLSYNTNKFTIDSGTGDTTITGNLTLSYSGGTDNGTKTSMITFKNSSNILGFVSTTETTDVLDGILGYRNSDGQLKFSTVIDGGSY